MKLRRCIAFGLVLALLLTGLPIDMLDGILVVEAAGVADESDFRIDESGCITKYVGDGGDVVIPDTIRGIKVTKIGSDAFWCDWNVISVTIPDGVTEIGDWAFRDCEDLVSIYIPKEVTSIGRGAFNGCRKLETIELSEAIAFIGEEAFCGCDNLSSIIVNSNNNVYKSIDGVLYSKSGETIIYCPQVKDNISLPKELTAIGNYAFCDCSKLTNIELPEGITSIGDHAFSGCSELTSIELPEGITTIGDYAFSECRELTSIELPEGITAIGAYTFNFCRKLMCIELPEGITTIGDYAFYECGEITNIELPESMVTIGAYAFSGCRKIANMELPEGITTIGDYAFQYCEKMKSINLPSGLTGIGACAFSGCSNLESAIIPNGVTNIANGLFSRCSGLSSVTIPDGVKSIGGGAFSGATSLVNIDIPEGITAIGGYAFSNCSNLKNITIPDGMTEIESGTFSGCSSLTNMELPNGIVAIGDYAFSGCSNLGYIGLPDHLVSIGMNAFDSCTKLVSVELPKSLTSINSQAFHKCSNLLSIDIDDNNKTYKSVDGIVYSKSGDTVICCAAGKDKAISLPKGVTTIGESAFSSCSKITYVELPEGITTIGEWAFGGCSSLTTIDLPDSLKTIDNDAFMHCSKLKNIRWSENLESIGSWAFSSCSGITSLELPDSLEWIGYCAFYGCGMTSAILPKSLTSIEYGLFYNCRDLTSVIIPEGVESIGRDAFRDCSEDLIIYGFEGSYAEEYAKEEGLAFEAITEGEVECTTKNIEATDGDICDIILQPKEQTSTAQEEFPSVGVGYKLYRASSTNYKVFTVTSAAKYDRINRVYKIRGYCKKAGSCKVLIKDAKGYIIDVVSVTVTPKDVNKHKTLSNNVFGVVVTDASNTRLKGMNVTINGESRTTNKEGYAEFNQKILRTTDNRILIKGGDYSSYSATFNKVKIDTADVPVLSYKMGVTNVYLQRTGSTDQFDVINNEVVISGEQRFSLTCKDDDKMNIIRYYLMKNGKMFKSNTSGVFTGLSENMFSENDELSLEVAYKSISRRVSIPLKIKIQRAIADDEDNLTSNVLKFCNAPAVKVPEKIPVIGGMECNIALPTFPVTYATGTEGNRTMYRVGINCQADVKEEKWVTWKTQINELKDKCQKGLNPKAEFEQLRKQTIENDSLGTLPGLESSCKVDCFGYLEGEQRKTKSGNSWMYVKGYLCVSITGELEHKRQMMINVIPVAMTVTFSAKADVIRELTLDLENKMLEYEMELATEIALKLKAGVGVCGVLEAGVFGKLALNMSSMIGTGYSYFDRMWLKGEIGLYATAGPFSLEKSLIDGTIDIFERKQSKVGSANPTASEADIYSNSEYSLLSASELSEESAWNNSKAKTSSSTLDIQPLLKNTYAGSRPKLASTGDTAIMVYTGYEDTSDMLNNGRVLYSVYKNNSWSEPQAVSDGECMQMSGTPVVCGNDIYVVYQQADSVMDGAAVTSPNEMAGHLEIAVAKYNKETGTFENAVTLTDSLPNTYNSLPTMGMYNSVPTAVWVNNENTDYFGTNTTNQIMMSQFVNGSWTEPKIVADNLNAVTELKLGTVGNTDRIAYLTDSDNDMLTADDRVLYLMDVNGQKNKISSGSQFGLTFANVPGTEGSSLMWSESGSIAYLSNANGKSAVIDTDANVTAFSCVGGRILYTAADEGESSNIYEISYDSKLSAWGNPVRMTNQTDYLRSLDGAEVNGEVIAVLMKTKVNDYVSEDELGTTDTLGWMKLGSIHDIALTYTNFENADIQLGENIPVSMDICNNGNQTVNGIRIVLTDADGKEIYAENKSVSILPGKTLEAVYDIPVPATLNGTDYTLTVTELNDAGQAVEELDKENNTDVLQFGLCDLSVFVMTEPVDYHVQQCTVTVTNEGAVPASAKITGYDGEETALKVSPIETEELAPGESVTYLIDLVGDSFESGELSEGVLFKLEPSVEDYNSSNDENGAAITKQCEVNFVTEDGTDMELFLEGAWVTLPELESGLVWSYDGKAVNEYQVWEDVTFTAVEGYRVSYAGGDADGGEMYDSTAAVSGQSVVLAENAFTRTGYTFAGWSDGTNLYQPGEEYTSENGDVVMTAQWKKVENAGDGSQTSGGETSGGSQASGGQGGSQTTSGQDGSQTTGGQDGSKSTSGADGSQSTGGQDGSQSTGGQGGSQTTGGQDGNQTTGGADGSQTTGGADGSQTTGGQDGSQTNGGQGGSQISGGTNADGSPSIGGADGSQSSGGQDGSQSTGGQGGSQSTSGADGSQPSAAITDPNFINNASSATANVGKVFTRSKLKYKVVDATSVELVGGLNKKITKLVIPTSVIYKGVTYKVTSIRKNAFSGYKKLATVKTGNSVKVIGSKAFYNCPKLTSISLGKNTTIIGASAFSKCTALKKIVIPSKVSSIGKQAFAGCKKLQSITIKSSKLTKKSIGAKAFSNISKKAVVKVPKKKLKSYKSFLYQKGLQKSVKIGKC